MRRYIVVINCNWRLQSEEKSNSHEFAELEDHKSLKEWTARFSNPVQGHIFVYGSGWISTTWGLKMCKYVAAIGNIVHFSSYTLLKFFFHRSKYFQTFTRNISCHFFFILPIILQVHCVRFTFLPSSNWSGLGSDKLSIQQQYWEFIRSQRTKNEEVVNLCVPSRHKHFTYISMSITNQQLHS